MTTTTIQVTDATNLMAILREQPTAKVTTKISEPGQDAWSVTIDVTPRVERLQDLVDHLHKELEKQKDRTGEVEQQLAEEQAINARHTADKNERIAALELELREADKRVEMKQKMREEAHNYAVALQRAIEAHCRGDVVQGKDCPHHAEKLNLYQKQELEAASKVAGLARERGIERDKLQEQVEHLREELDTTQSLHYRATELLGKATLENQELRRKLRQLETKA